MNVVGVISSDETLNNSIRTNIEATFGDTFILVFPEEGDGLFAVAGGDHLEAVSQHYAVDGDQVLFVFGYQDEFLHGFRSVS